MSRHLKFLNGNDTYYPSDSWLTESEIFVGITPKTYENLPNDSEKIFINSVEIQPSSDFEKLSNGRYLKKGDARMIDAPRMQTLDFNAPPLQYNNLGDAKKVSGIGEHRAYTTLDTGHNRYYTTNKDMSVYPDMNYTLDVDVVRVLRKYPDGTVRPWYYRRLKDDAFKDYQNTNQFMRDSTYYREDFTETITRDMNSRDYEFNYFY